MVVLICKACERNDKRGITRAGDRGPHVRVTILVVIKTVVSNKHVDSSSLKVVKL